MIWEKGEEALAMAEQKAINEARRQKERDRAERRLREIERREQLQREIEDYVDQQRGIGMNNFKFELNQMVRIVESNETGLVVGRADYATAEQSFLIRYKAADGRAVEQWWTLTALVAA